MPLRVLVGPLFIAAASWCASGHVAVADAAAADPRIADPASPWVAVGAFLCAMLVRGWRRSPLTAAPALVATLPWWPVPLPAAALIWTGPIAWAPVLLAFVAASNLRAWNVAIPPDRSAWLAGLLTMGLAVAVAVTLSPRLPGGDEPHYLVITQSLLQDADLDIANNHEARDYAAYFPGDLRPDFVRPGRHAETYSIHAPGLPVLVLPGFAIFGYRGAQFTLMVIAAITGALIWRIGWRLTGNAAATWLSWAAVVGSPTFLVQSVTIFPDGPGALAVAAAVSMLVQSPNDGATFTRGRIVVVSLLLACLPWLHTRFAVLAGVLGCAIVWRIAAGDRAGRARRIAIFSVAPAISAAAWFGYFFLLYGTFDPAAPYGQAGDRAWAFAPGGVAGMLFDQQFGALAYGPVLIVGLRGLAAVGRKPHRAVLPVIVAAAAAYLVVTGTYWMWWAGVPAPPARFLTAVLPVVAALVAVGAARLQGTARLLATMALAWSAAVSVCVIAVGRGALLWNVRDGQAVWLNWLSPVVNLPRGWPSFFWRLTPPVVATEWPFAIHVALWLLVLVVISGAAVVGAGRMKTAAEQAAVVALGVLLALAAGVQAGWWLNGTNGLDPARAQLRVMTGAVHGHALVRIGSFSIARERKGATAIGVRPEEAPRFRPGWPWASFDGVPAGEYELTIVRARPRAGTLVVGLAGRSEPLATLPLAPVGEQTVGLSLPDGASRVTLDVGEEGSEAANLVLRRKQQPQD